jgi:hypothetical protein
MDSAGCMCWVDCLALTWQTQVQDQVEEEGKPFEKNSVANSVGSPCDVAVLC